MESVYLNGGYLGTTREYSSAYGEITDFTFVDSYTDATGTDGVSFTIPATAQAGDLCLVFEGIDEDRTVQGPPTGFTTIAAHDPAPAAGNVTAVVSYKVLVSGDPGTTLSTNTYADEKWVTCVVFRPVGGKLKDVVLASDVDGDATTANPAAQTVSSSVSSGPLIVICHMSNRWTQSLTGISTTNFDDFVANGTIQRVYYKIYDSSTVPSDSSADIGDNGAQVLQTFFLKFTSVRGTESYNSGIWNLQSALDSVSANKTIVQDQLMLWIDPSVRETYPGYNLYLNDLSGNHANFQLSSSGATYDTDGGGSIAFDAVNGRATGPTWLIPTGSYSASVWLKGPGYAQTISFVGIFHKSGTATNNSGNYGFLGDAGGNYIRFVFHDGTNSQEVDANGLYNDLADNIWVQYTGVYDSVGQTLKLYRNGILINTTESITTSPTTSTSNPAYIGDRQNDNKFEGNIGEVLLYNKALTAGEVFTNYSVSKGRYSS